MGSWEKDALGSILSIEPPSLSAAAFTGPLAVASAAALSPALVYTDPLLLFSRGRTEGNPSFSGSRSLFAGI